MEVQDQLPKQQKVRRPRARRPPEVSSVWVLALTVFAGYLSSGWFVQLPVFGQFY